MKLSLILQAIDRASAPAKRVEKAVRGIADRGIRPVEAAARRVSGLGSRLFGDMPARLDRIRTAARRVADGGFRVMHMSALLAARGVGKLIRSGLDLGRNALIAAGAGAGILGGWLTAGVIGQASKFEQFQVVLENTEGSAEKARKAMAWVKTFAKTTPYEIGDVMEAFVALKAYGIDAANGSLVSLGNAASGMGKPLMQAIEMLADAQTGEFERLKEFGIRAKQQGDTVTFTYMRAGREVSRTAKKSSAEIQRAVLGIFDERFKGMMDRQSRTLAGMWSNIQDMLANFQLDVAGAGFFDTVKGKVQALLDWINAKAKDGSLQRWAQEVSTRLTEMADKAWEFAHTTDWKQVGQDVQSVGSALWTVVKALATAVHWAERLVSLGAGIDAKFGFDNGSNSLESKAWSVLSWDPLGDRLWGKGKPTGPAAPARAPAAAPSGRPMAPRQLWQRALSAPANAGPRKIALDVRLSGPGAAQASVRRISAPADVDTSVSRGRAMAGAA